MTRMFQRRFSLIGLNVKIRENLRWNIRVIRVPIFYEERH